MAEACSTRCDHDDSYGPSSVVTHGALRGCRAKLARARKHLDDLLESIGAWGDPNPHSLEKSFDGSTKEFVLRVRTVRLPPLDDWGAAVGDVLHNLHSTLDSLVCVLINEKVPNHDCRGRGFPILDHAADWDRAKKGGTLNQRSGLAQIEETDDWAKTTIRGLQPFHLPREDRKRNALWLLRELSNADKHRAIHVSSFFLYPPEIEFDPPDSGEMTWARPAGPFADGDEVLRFKRRPPSPTNLRVEGTVFKWDMPKTHRNISLGADLTFEDGPPAYGARVDALLEWLFSYVTWIVDSFDYKYFGGNPPAGTEHITLNATRTATVAEQADP